MREETVPECRGRGLGCLLHPASIKGGIVNTGMSVRLEKWCLGHTVQQSIGTFASCMCEIEGGRSGQDLGERSWKIRGRGRFGRLTGAGGGAMRRIARLTFGFGQKMIEEGGGRS